MKKLTLTITTILLLSTSLFAQNKLSIDLKKSTLIWTGHAEVGTYAPKGTLNIKEGSILQNKEFKIMGAVLLIDMKSMNQDNEHLLSHLKSEDFFDVEKYQTSTVKIEKISDGIAYGQLTIKGRTQAFQCPVTIKKENSHFVISGNTIIDRTKFGIIYNSGNFFTNLGDKAIRNTFDIEFNLVTN